MARKIIEFDRSTNRFMIGRDPLRTEQIGRLLANAIMAGDKTVNLCNRVEVTPNYLVEMLRFTAEYGYFWDCWELAVSGSDHDFNPDVPTPGPYWNKFEALLQEAKEMREGAHRARHMAQLESVAQEADALADELESRARQLLVIL